jgi:hypothetical protein
VIEEVRRVAVEIASQAKPVPPRAAAAFAAAMKAAGLPYEAMDLADPRAMD